MPLPDGFYPEGIAIGSGHDFYVGSLLDGAVYKGDLRTGEGDLLVAGAAGRLVAGLSFDNRSGLLWGVGSDGGSGAALAIDGTTGELVAHVEVPGAFLNDIVVTREAAYITDSLADVFWTIPLDNRGRPGGAARAIPLTGDFSFVTTGELPINLNGITATPNGTSLLAVHSTLGLLYRIDPISGEATEIDLGAVSCPPGTASSSAARPCTWCRTSSTRSLSLASIPGSRAVRSPRSSRANCSGCRRRRRGSAAVCIS